MRRSGPPGAARPAPTLQAPGSVSCVRPGRPGGSFVAQLSFLAGFGAGYVLGSKAGRERYEQIRRAYAHAKDDPCLQSLAGMAQARADDALSSLLARMGSDAPRCPSRSVRLLGGHQVGQLLACDLTGLRVAALGVVVEHDTPLP